MRWAYVTVSALTAVVAIAVTALVGGLSVRRVVLSLAWGVPAFVALGWWLAKIGRATAEELARGEFAPPTVPEPPPARAAPEGT